jgi:glycosyltransferase involved in cell wall biosynthesis
MPAALPPLGPNFALRRIAFPRLWTHARLSAELLAHAPDVLFVPAHVLPLGAPLRRRMRTVVTVHDMGYLRFPEAHTPAQRLYLRLSTIWSARAATQLIAISAATRDDLVRFAGVRPEKIAVVHHGLSPRFRPAADAAIAAALRRYGIVGANEHAVGAGDHQPTGEYNGRPYILYVGTVQPRKNLVRLIEAFAYMLEIRDWRLEIGTSMPNPQSLISNLQLVIAGKRGWLTEEIEQRAAALGIAERVRFTGYVADEDLPALLSGALAFVLPSLYEGFGMPVLEAMACGAPVLASNTSALPEVAGDAALLVDPGDTAAIASGLARLAADAGLRADLRARGLAHAAQFTWDRCAEQTLAVLKGIRD